MANINIPIPDILDRVCVWPLLEYRRLQFGYPFRKIPLGDGLFTIVDPDDYYWLNKFQWGISAKNGVNEAVKTLYTSLRIHYNHLGVDGDTQFRRYFVCSLAEAGLDFNSKGRVENAVSNILFSAPPALPPPSQQG